VTASAQPPGPSGSDLAASNRPIYRLVIALAWLLVLVGGFLSRFGGETIAFGAAATWAVGVALQVGAAVAWLFDGRRGA
jgi:hypothetical protein